MFFSHHEKFSASETLARTIFLTSLVSFVVFLFLDLLRAGFVSNTFSVHWFLLAAIISGIWWSCVIKEIKERKWLQNLSVFLLGLAEIYLAWGFRAALGDFLVLVLPLAFLTPFLVLYLLRK